MPRPSMNNPSSITSGWNSALRTSLIETIRDNISADVLTLIREQSHLLQGVSIAELTEAASAPAKRTAHVERAPNPEKKSKPKVVAAKSGGLAARVKKAKEEAPAAPVKAKKPPKKVEVSEPESADDGEKLDLRTVEQQQSYQSAILEMLQAAPVEEPWMASSEIQNIVGGSGPQIRKHLALLEGAGKIEHTGKARGTKYRAA